MGMGSSVGSPITPGNLNSLKSRNQFQQTVMEVINNVNSKKKKKRNNSIEYEFCKVCKLHHNQGRRHNYFPNHVKSLSSFLSRFLNKLSDIHFFLKTPALLRPEHASRNRLWCVFCDFDIDEIDSLFVCDNAIRHLASAEHLKKLKNFLWKYGGGMDRVDSFRVSESDLIKWEKKCKALNNATPSSTSSGKICGPIPEDPNDIHDKIYSDTLDNFERSTLASYELSISNGFVPLQNFTIEKIQVSHPKVCEVANHGSRLHDATSLAESTHNKMDMQGMYGTENIINNLEGYKDNKQTLRGNCKKPSAGWAPGNGKVGRLGNGESSNEDSKANVHSGAPPPWFEKTEEELNDQIGTGFQMNSQVLSSKKSGKSQKLNPNRIGAAWAEKRKIELEMEKKGVTITDSCDPNWLPNFGRVWQSGSRKESRKEFEVESRKTSSPPEMQIKLQPYISKRMRKESDECMHDVGGNLK